MTSCTLIWGRYFRQACHIYDSIGDDWLRGWPWPSTERFVEMREWAPEEADDPDHD